jgi:ketosteroid isomerase-like protein
MSAPVETVKRFYERLKAGDVPGLTELMADDIEWETMLDFGLDERGPQPIIDAVLAPLMAEWASFSPEPSEFINAENNTVVSVGTFTCVHRATGKRASATYAHIWTVRDDKVARFRQYIDTLAIVEARKP